MTVTLAPPNLQTIEEEELEEEEDIQTPNNNESVEKFSFFHKCLNYAQCFQANPYYLIPVVLIMSFSRGITMSPRIHVYKMIACRALINDFETSASTILSKCNEAEVQARAARIQASFVTTMSILSAISTGFWSRLGERWGRKPILLVSMLGTLITEVIFVLVMREGTIYGRYAENLVLLGPVTEGLVGAIATFNGTIHVYISDCTQHGSRSKIFSMMQGIAFVGMALGPGVGGVFFPSSGYSSIFFFTSVATILMTMLYVVTLLPESLHRSAQTKNSSSSQPESKKAQNFMTSPVQFAGRHARQVILTVLSPIFAFAPRSVPGQSSKMNYSVTFIGIALFFYLMSTGIYQAKYLYAQHLYSWTTAELGYYMSTLWITRAINLLVILPLIISYLKPKANLTFLDMAAEMRFDRYLAQISLAVDGLADALVVFISSQSQATFIFLSCLTSFTSGGNPALHSLGAVCLHACGYSSEVGALFGAMAVLAALGHIVSPSIYALVYGRTVVYFPQSIFVLAATLLFIAVLLLAAVKPVDGGIPLAQMVSTSVNQSQGDFEYNILADDECQEDVQYQEMSEIR